MRPSLFSPTEGYLDKLKHKVSFFGSWNKRYFRMNIAGERLEYFASEKAVEKGEVKGFITLANLKAVRKFDDLTFQIDGMSILDLHHYNLVIFVPSISISCSSLTLVLYFFFPNRRFRWCLYVESG